MILLAVRQNWHQENWSVANVGLLTDLLGGLAAVMQ